MSLDQQDIELIQRMMFKNNDDITVSIARSFERLEERIDAAEARIHSRCAELEDKIEASRQDTADMIGEMKDEVRDAARIREY